MSAAHAQAMAYQRGIARNRNQFLLQTLQVFFVGLVIGMERTVLPSLAQDFGVAKGAFLFLASFVISFGLVKGALNLVAGSLSDHIGRKRVLLLGWIAGIPIPLLIFFAPNWWWIVAANVFLGINQAFTWTMTVTSQIDLAGSRQRGLAVGINEAAGYLGMGLAGLATGYLAVLYGPRWALLLFGLGVILLALVLLLCVRDTIAWVHAEHAAHPVSSPPPKRSWMQGFLEVSFRNPRYRAFCQAGVANKVADTLVWVLFPLYFLEHAMGVVAIGWITGVYGAVWGLSQLWTGHLADRIGRKIPIVSGFFLLSAGLVATALLQGFVLWVLAALIMGLGMALLYPNLVAAMSDLAPPLERGRILGVYRYWRDTGYAIGGLLLGLVAQWSNEIRPAIWVTAGIVALSGLWVALAVKETHPRPVQKKGNV
ncbi:MFS transporter [Acidithiobacillus sulfuriphilus]|uniref:MFS transporter n=2 Tax=Acidithiobacillus sulfuriphilus TaxID=1867749 RepID=A0A3M8QSW6_9PROT|nr:MFS transporter [Acidithiobacillus sulfuriphilus]RNF59336.1 MFS transporter [Acidithiobacillus sulfuriphilus]